MESKFDKIFKEIIAEADYSLGPNATDGNVSITVDSEPIEDTSLNADAEEPAELKPTEPEPEQEKFVKITSGEANGRDDSDGFDIIADLRAKKIIVDNWTTRFARIGKKRETVDFNSISEQEKEEVKKIAVDFLASTVKLDDYQTTSLSNTHDGSYRGIPCKVTKGRLFRGEGELVEVYSKSFDYGYGYSRGTSTSWRAVIKTADGQEKEANADYVELLVTPELVKQVIEKYWRNLLSDYGYKQLPAGHFSRDPWFSDYILKFYSGSSN